MSDTAVETPRRKVDYSKDVVTEQDKLHLVMQIADEIGRKYRIDPCELWGVGWEACALAGSMWRPTGSMMSFMRTVIRSRILNGLRVRKIHEITVSGLLNDSPDESADV